MNLRIITNGKCLLNCVYCHNEGSEQKLKLELNNKEIVNILKKIKQSLPIKGTTISGFEPLHFKNIFPLIKVLRKHTNIRIITSGATMRKIPKEVFKLIDIMTISIPSISDENYMNVTNQKKITPKNIFEFIRSIDNKKIVTEINIPIKIGLNDNLEDFNTMIKICKYLSIDNLRFILINNENEKILFNKISKMSLTQTTKRIDHRINYLSTVDAVNLYFVVCTKPPECLTCNFPSDIYLYVNGQIKFCLNSTYSYSYQNLLECNVTEIYKDWKSRCHKNCMHFNKSFDNKFL